MNKIELLPAHCLEWKQFAVAKRFNLWIYKKRFIYILLRKGGDFTLQKLNW